MDRFGSSSFRCDLSGSFDIRSRLRSVRYPECQDVVRVMSAIAIVLYCSQLRLESPFPLRSLSCWSPRSLEAESHCFVRLNLTQSICFWLAFCEPQDTDSVLRRPIQATRRTNKKISCMTRDLRFRLGDTCDQICRVWKLSMLFTVTSLRLFIEAFRASIVDHSRHPSFSTSSLQLHQGQAQCLQYGRCGGQTACCLPLELLDSTPGASNCGAVGFLKLQAAPLSGSMLRRLLPWDCSSSGFVMSSAFDLLDLRHFEALRIFKFAQAFPPQSLLWLGSSMWHSRHFEMRFCHIPTLHVRLDSCNFSVYRCLIMWT